MNCAKYPVCETTLLMGRGLAFEAASALIKICFEQFEVDAVRAGAQTANEVSHNLIVKLGMQIVGEELVFAPARNRKELCTYFEVAR
jgi:[ribosomal protein S5]-alanine N-acetyltransferase